LYICYLLLNSFDALGQLKRIHWSHFARDSKINLPLEEVEPLYKAMKHYDNILNDESVYIKYKMEPGQIFLGKDVLVTKYDI